jgi:hypothetical protein
MAPNRATTAAPARHRPSRPTRLAVAAVALSATLGACGGETGDGEETQPLPGATGFAEGGFDELPRYPGAEAASEPATQDDVTSQSFTIATATPERVMEHYEAELEEAGWTTVDAPARQGAESTYRGRWRQGERELIVSATEFSGFDEPGGTRTTQYSLSLGPA